MTQSLFFGSVEIAEFPPDWGKVRIDENLVDILGGFACARKNSVSNGVPHLRPFNIDTQGQVIITDDTVHIPPGFRNDLDRYHLLPGDVLFNNTNSVELVGKTAMVREPMAVAFSNHITRLRAKDINELDPRWLALSLRLLFSQGIFAQYCNKWIGQAGFSTSALAQTEIPLPPLETQGRIVARIEALFADLRAARELHETIVEDTDRLMDAVLAEVFDAASTREWANEKALGDLIEINAPLVDPTLSKYRDLPHIHGQVIEEGIGRLSPYRTATEDGMRSGKYLFEPGSVLYSKIRPYLRKVTTVDFEGLCSADIYPLELKTDEIEAEFLMWALLSPGFTDYANSLSGRARMPKLNREQLFAYSLRFPNRLVQASFSHHLSSVRDEIVQIKRTGSKSATELAETEQAILAQAFRGEL